MPIQIQLDKPRELHYGIRATRDLEQQLGKPLGRVLEDITNFGVNTIITALFYGLRHEDKGLTLNLTEKLFETHVHNKKGVRVLIKAISDALEETGMFTTEDEVPEGNATTERPN